MVSIERQLHMIQPKIYYRVYLLYNISLTKYIKHRIDCPFVMSGDMKESFGHSFPCVVEE